MKLNDFYVCSECGNVIEVLVVGAPALVCCGQKMTKLEPKTADAGLEKHVPVIESVDGGIVVKVGSVPHPMEKAHHICFVQVFKKDGKIGRVHLDKEPVAVLELAIGDVDYVVSYCNIHGLWIGKP